MDFYNSDEWLDYRIAKNLGSNSKTLEYLNDSLKKAKDFNCSLARFPLTDQKFVVITSDSWPTPTRLKAYFKIHRSRNHPITEQSSLSEIKISSPSHFVAGDGIVAKDTAMMPLGYDYHVLYTKFSHIRMMNDLETVEKALALIYGHER